MTELNQKMYKFFREMNIEPVCRRCGKARYKFGASPSDDRLFCPSCGDIVDPLLHTRVMLEQNH